MTVYIRWLLPLSCLAAGLYLLRLSYRAYAKWQEALAIGDMSLVEAYELEFWPEVSLGLYFVLFSAFLAGRWSLRNR